MTRAEDGRISRITATVALAIANVRYWPGVAPRVRRELRRWKGRADEIADPALRALALAKLRDEHFNAEVAATLATLAPLRWRARVVTATVAFQIIYDYLDAVTEQRVAQPLRNGRQLYRAFAAALAPGPFEHDCYRHHPQQDDGGYLDALTTACRTAFHALPAAHVVAPVARRAAARCGEAQTHTHAVAQEGIEQLASWAKRQTSWPRLTWWEVAAGGAASVLSVHALLAAAADPRTTRADANWIDAAYLPVCALTTLLDSLVDDADDVAAGGHAFFSYYADDASAAERLVVVAREALSRVATLRHAPHHAMTVCGAVAYYLSAPGAQTARARRTTAPLTAELQPLIGPILRLFGAWRYAKRRLGAMPGGSHAHSARAERRSRSARIPGQIGSINRRSPSEPVPPD